MKKNIILSIVLILFICSASFAEVTAQQANPKTDKAIQQLFDKFSRTADIKQKIELVEQIYDIPQDEENGIEPYIDINDYDNSVNSNRAKRKKILCDFLDQIENKINNEKNADLKYSLFKSAFEFKAVIDCRCQDAKTEDYIYVWFVNFCVKEYADKISLEQLLDVIGRSWDYTFELKKDGKKDVLLDGLYGIMVGEAKGKLTYVELPCALSNIEILKTYDNGDSKQILIKCCGGNGEGGCTASLIGYENDKLTLKFSSKDSEDIKLTNDGFDDGEKLIVMEKIVYKGPRFQMIYKWNGNGFDDVTLKYKSKAIDFFNNMLTNYEKLDYWKITLAEYEKYFSGKSADYKKFWESDLKPLVIKYGTSLR